MSARYMHYTEMLLKTFYEGRAARLCTGIRGVHGPAKDGGFFQQAGVQAGK